MIKKFTYSYGLFLLWFSSMVYGEDKPVDIGAPSSGPLANIGAFFQEIVDFLGGAGVMFAVFVSLVGAIGLWVLIPKQAGAAIAWLFRACVGAIALFGAGTLIAWIQGLSG